MKKFVKSTAFALAALLTLSVAFTGCQKKEEPAPATKAMSKEELRAFLGVKSLAGHRDTIQALIRKYGGQKFSDIDPSHYPALQKDAEELPDAT